MSGDEVEKWEMPMSVDGGGVRRKKVPDERKMVTEERCFMAVSVCVCVCVYCHYSSSMNVVGTKTFVAGC